MKKKNNSKQLGRIIDKLEKKIKKEKEDGFLTLAGDFCKELANIYMSDEQWKKAKETLKAAETHYQEVGKAPPAEEGLVEVKKMLKKVEENFGVTKV